MPKTNHKRRGPIFVATGVAVALSGLMTVPSVNAAGFNEDATVKGGLYYFQRERDRLDVTTNTRKTNLSHSTWNAGLEYSSGYVGGIFGLDLALMGVIDMADSAESGHPNEIALSRAHRAYAEDFSGDRSGAKPYRAAAKFKFGDTWIRAGYIQPTGQTLLATHWGMLPGTYQGAEVGTKFDYGSAGVLQASYMWTNRYEAPWYVDFDGFYRNDKITKVKYLHSIGLKYDFGKNLVLETAFGQAAKYVDQYFLKTTYAFGLAGNPMTTSWQFYGSRDKVSDGGVNDLYDGLAWLQALTMEYKVDKFGFRLEGTRVRAPGNQGFFLQRMTPTYASSNGRLDVGWNNRSDFNADGENAVFAGVTYDLSGLNLAGFSVGASYAYGWDARPSRKPSDDGFYKADNRLSESAWSGDVAYTVPSGSAKGTVFALHYTQYNNHSTIPSGGGGYGNIFQDEYDVKFQVTVPLSIL